MDTITLSFSPEIHCEATAIDPELPTRFSGVAYSGGLIPKFGPYGDAAIDLATLQPADRLFMLVNHDPDQRAGHGRIWIEGQQVRIEGQFARSTDAGRQIAAEFRDGAPWQLSVGMQSQTAHPREPVTVNGQSLSVKTLFQNAAIREVSFVPIGADPHTSITAFSSDSTPPGDPMTDDTVTALQAQIADLETQLAAQKSAREAAESAMAQVQANARIAVVKALFADLGKDYTDAAAAPYLAIPDDTLAALAADLRSAKAVQIDPALTREVAISGAAAPDLAKLSAKIMAQVAGKEIK